MTANRRCLSASSLVTLHVPFHSWMAIVHLLFSSETFSDLPFHSSADVLTSFFPRENRSAQRELPCPSCDLSDPTFCLPFLCNERSAGIESHSSTYDLALISSFLKDCSSIIPLLSWAVVITTQTCSSTC